VRHSQKCLFRVSFVPSPGILACTVVSCDWAKGSVAGIVRIRGSVSD
jgi:hypothetical protein